MPSSRYASLRNKLLLPFALLGFAVSALLSGITYGLVADLEQRNIRRMLQFELESFRYRKERNPNALLPATSVIRGFFLPTTEFPRFRTPSDDKPHFSSLRQDERHYTALTAHVDGIPCVLMYDRTFTDHGLVQLAWLLVGGVVLMTVLSGLVGNRLAGQVVKPIGRLLRDISEKSESIDPRAIGPMRFAPADYPKNEIGRLALALDRFADRLFGFVQRESYFASDVSHELRTPVAVIRGAAEILVEHPNLDAPTRTRVETIHRQSVRMAELLEAMLLLARENPRTADPACALAEVVRDAIADAQPALGDKPVTIGCTIHARPIIAAERSMAYVVISNLLRNACAHTREGHVGVDLYSDRVEIADTGIGIPEDRFPGIFDRYVKGEESGGSGLGLSIVARVTQALGWTIALQSQPGEGTRATLAFGSASRSAP